MEQQRLQKQSEIPKLFTRLIYSLFSSTSNAITPEVSKPGIVCSLASLLPLFLSLSHTHTHFCAALPGDVERAASHPSAPYLSNSAPQWTFFCSTTESKTEICR